MEKLRILEQQLNPNNVSGENIIVYDENYVINKTNQDYQRLMELVKEMLEAEGSHHLLAYVPFSAKVLAKEYPTVVDRDEQVRLIGLCFQMLNMVEENILVVQAKR